jgi:hypothetical protein
MFHGFYFITGMAVKAFLGIFIIKNPAVSCWFPVLFAGSLTGKGEENGFIWYLYA